MAELESALQATAAEFVADEQKYASVPSVVQISEVVELRAARSGRSVLQGGKKRADYNSTLRHLSLTGMWHRQRQIHCDKRLPSD